MWHTKEEDHRQHGKVDGNEQSSRHNQKGGRQKWVADDNLQRQSAKSQNEQ